MPDGRTRRNPVQYRETPLPRSVIRNTDHLPGQSNGKVQIRIFWIQPLAYYITSPKRF